MKTAMIRALAITILSASTMGWADDKKMEAAPTMPSSQPCSGSEGSSEPADREAARKVPRAEKEKQKNGKKPKNEQPENNDWLLGIYG